ETPQCFTVRWNLAESCPRWLENERGDIVPGHQPIFHLPKVIRGCHQGVFHNAVNHPGRSAGRKADMVVPAVKVPGEADDLALSGECARYTQRQVRRLRSGHRESHALRGWNQ